MEIAEARSYINRTVELIWLDRKGQELREIVQVLDVGFLPLYGPCLITSVGEIRLERVKDCLSTSLKVAA